MAGKHAHKWYLYVDDHELISEEDQIGMYACNERESSNRDVVAERDAIREEALEWIDTRENDWGIVQSIEVPDDYPLDKLRSGEYYDHNYVSV